MSAVSVEGKWQGFICSWAKSDFGTLAFDTFSNGAGARLSGGNFWQGAATGLTIGLLNHTVRKMDGDKI